ncbi:MAG: hypothetical protein ACFFDF_00310 [Candidatus Odinarchaeota archaeon]
MKKIIKTIEKEFDNKGILLKHKETIVEEETQYKLDKYKWEPDPYIQPYCGTFGTH